MPVGCPLPTTVIGNRHYGNARYLCGIKIQKKRNQFFSILLLHPHSYIHTRLYPHIIILLKELLAIDHDKGNVLQDQSLALATR